MSRVIALVLAIFGTTTLFAQSVGTAGTIEGTVLDPSGAVVQSANVTLSNEFMNYRVTSVTDEKGQFYFSNIPPNTYHLIVTTASFATLPSGRYGSLQGTDERSGQAPNQGALGDSERERRSPNRRRHGGFACGNRFRHLLQIADDLRGIGAERHYYTRYARVLSQTRTDSFTRWEIMLRCRCR